MSWTLQDAKNQFSALVDAALTDRPQFVTRRGRPAVVVLATSDYERLAQAQAQAMPSFKAHLRRTDLDEPRPQEGERLLARPRDIAF